MHRRQKSLAFVVFVLGLQSWPSSAFETESVDILVVTSSKHEGDPVDTGDRSIKIASNIDVYSISSVNGDMHVEDGARIAFAETTGRGDIRLERNVRSIAGLDSPVRIISSTGNIFIGRGSRLNGGVETNMGRIELDDARVADIASCEGDVIVGAGSRVSGGIYVIGNGDKIDVDKITGYEILTYTPCHAPVEEWSDEEGSEARNLPLAPTAAHRQSRVVIGPGAVVKGNLVFGHPVDLYVHKSAHIGKVHGATAVIYDSEEPPPSTAEEGGPSPTALVVGAGKKMRGDIWSIDQNVEIGSNANVGEISTVNGSVHVLEGAEVSQGFGSIDTVQGAVHIGPGATVKGYIATVNGDVFLEDRANVSGSVSTTTGQVRIARDAKIGRGLSAKYGSIFAGSGSQLESVSSARGDIAFVATLIQGNVCTHTGNITVGAGSRVDGAIQVSSSECFGSEDEVPGPEATPPRIVVGPNVEVRDGIVSDKPIKLYVHRAARVGKITGAEAILYDSDTPPQE